VANAVLDPRDGPGVAQPKVHMLFNVETAWRLCTWVIIVRCWFTSAVRSDMDHRTYPQPLADPPRRSGPPASQRFMKASG
jgi:hypothetical protein